MNEMEKMERVHGRARTQDDKGTMLIKGDLHGIFNVITLSGSMMWNICSIFPSLKMRSASTAPA